MATAEPRRFLLAIDGSPHADRAAQYLACNGAALAVGEVCLLNVQPLGHESYASPDDERLRTVAELSAEATANARRLLGEANLPYKPVTEVGDAAEAIVDAAQETRADEIVLGRHGSSQLERLILGSVAYKVIHRAAVPVTVVEPPAAGAGALQSTAVPKHRVLLPFDGSEQAKRAVDYVVGLCRGSVPFEVELFHAPTVIPSTMLPIDKLVDAHYEELGKTVLRDAEDALRTARIPYTARVVPGNPAEKIVEAAEEGHCTRIVMGTRGPGALASVFLGSVAYRVVQLSPIPVTLVK
jgi:nucleotide-binding universal stress UspA family protein